MGISQDNPGCKTMKPYKIFLLVAAILALLSCTENDFENPADSGNTLSPVDSLSIQILSLSSVQVSWVHDGFTDHYRVDRKINTSNWQDEYKLLDESTRSFTDTGLAINDQILYRVYAIADENISNPTSDDVTISFPAPYNLELSQTSVSSCQLAWQYYAIGGESGFRIDRKVGSGSWSQIADVSIGTLSYADEGLETGLEYSYRVYAYTSDYTGNAAEENITLDDVPDNIILVPAGSFQMGRTGVATPIHTVNLDAFYIGTYEVTHQEVIDVYNWAYQQGYVNCSTSTVTNAQGNSQELLNINSSYCAIDWNGSQLVFGGSSIASDPQCPVIEITWYGAVAYCNYLSLQEGLTPCYDLSDWSCNWSASGYLLPTEAEWEYAARGCTNSPDYLYAGSDTCGDVAWYGSNSGSTTHAAGDDKDPVTYPGNGVTYNMSGNVYEWCWDWYSSSYYSSSPVDNPTGPTSGSTRVNRGGGWSNSAIYCGVASRYYNAPSYAYRSIGFRVCRRAE